MPIRLLRRRFRNEDAHADHVTQLVFWLFDALSAHLGLEPSAWPILRSAAALHDIGYAADPERHAETGAAIVRDCGLPAAGAAFRDDVAWLIRLHCGSWATLKPEAAAIAAPARRRLLTLAALLRIADGLDHGHMQDCAVAGVDYGHRDICVRLTAGWYAANVDCARAKADLWRELVGIPVRFECDTTPDRGLLFAGLFSEAPSVLDAARCLLNSQFRIIVDNRIGVERGSDPEHLHDMRVAVRRFRAALRLFRPHLAETSAEQLGRRFATFQKRLGPARDMDVWMAFLQHPKRLRHWQEDPDWPPFLAAQRQQRRQALAELQGLLRARAYRELMHDTRCFLRIELAAAARDCLSETAATHVAAKLGKTLRRVRKRGRGLSRASAEDMHAFRRLCRRERYWAEFGAPLLGPDVQDLAVRMKNLADILGDIHDMDLYRERACGASVPAPAALAALLERFRSKAVAGFEQAWKRIPGKPCGKAAQQRPPRSRRTGE